MSLQKILLSRRTIHDYRRDPVSDEWIRQALEAASHAPNHKNTFPWRFYWVGAKTRNLIADLSVQLRQEKDGAALPQTLIEAVRAKILDPYALIVFARVQSSDDFQAREDYAAVACAVQNFSLSLWEKGIGTKWSTGAITRHPEVYKMLGIDPKLEAIEGFVWAGAPLRIPSKPERPGLDQLLRHLP